MKAFALALCLTACSGDGFESEPEAVADAGVTARTDAKGGGGVPLTRIPPFTRPSVREGGITTPEASIDAKPASLDAGTDTLDAAVTLDAVALPDAPEPPIEPEPEAGACVEPSRLCSGQCVSLYDVNHCGTCDRVCETPGAVCKNIAQLARIECACPGCLDAVGQCTSFIPNSGCAIAPCDKPCL
jgi:hypothetical protein